MTPNQLVASMFRGRDESVAVTGATGWFGRTALELLFEAFGDEAPQRISAYGSRAGSVILARGQQVPVRPLTELAHSATPPTGLLHFAFLTRDRLVEQRLEEYVATNVSISALVIDAIRRLRPRWVVSPSSGAVYQPDRTLTTDLSGNPYGALKVIDELTVSAAAAEVAAGCAIPRVFAVAGPWMTKPDEFAIGSMLAMARGGGPIEVRANRPVVRAYCGIDEVVALSMWAAARGGTQIFDTGGEPTEMAGLAALIANEFRDCPISRASFDAAAQPDTYVGDPRVMLRLAADAGLELRELAELVRFASSHPSS